MAATIKDIMRQKKTNKRQLSKPSKFVDDMSNRSKFEAYMIRQGLGK